MIIIARVGKNPLFGWGYVYVCIYGVDKRDAAFDKPLSV